MAYPAFALLDAVPTALNFATCAEAPALAAGVAAEEVALLDARQLGAGLAAGA